MTDIETIREVLELAQRLDGMGQARFAARWSAGKLALERIVRLAARVGDGWCFDMQKAPKDGTPLWLMATNKTSHEGAWKVCGNSIFQEGWYWAPYAYGGVGPISVMAWHTLSPPPETS